MQISYRYQLHHPTTLFINARKPGILSLTHFPTSHTYFFMNFLHQRNLPGDKSSPYYFHICFGTRFHKAARFCTRQGSRALCHPDTQEWHCVTRIIMRINIENCPSDYYLSKHEWEQYLCRSNNLQDAHITSQKLRRSQLVSKLYIHSSCYRLLYFTRYIPHSINYMLNGLILPQVCIQDDHRREKKWIKL